MKFQTLLFGIVIFTVSLSLMFSFAGNILKESELPESDVDVFTNLAVQYEDLTDEQTADGSDIRNIGDATEAGTASSDTSDIFLLTGAIQGIRLVGNSIGNIKNVVNTAYNTTTTGDTAIGDYIDPRIIATVIALIVIIIIIIVVTGLRGFKLEA